MPVVIMLLCYWMGWGGGVGGFCYKTTIIPALIDCFYLSLSSINQSILPSLYQLVQFKNLRSLLPLTSTTHKSSHSSYIQSIQWKHPPHQIATDPDMATSTPHPFTRLLANNAAFAKSYTPSPSMTQTRQRLFSDPDAKSALIRSPPPSPLSNLRN